jgi:hypothetical protein
MRKNPMSSKTYHIVLLFIAAFSLWLRTGFPVHPMPEMVYDDALFIQLARTLERGHWLGLYNNLTLAKGIFYPLFIVVAFWTSIPLKIAEQMLYLAASWLTAGIVQRRLGNRYPSLILFALLAFNPVVWNFEFARVLRQGIYLSLSLALVSLFAAVAFPIFDQEKRSSRGLLWKGAALGLVTAAYWMTREEGVWLLPTVTVVTTVALMGIWKPNWRPISEQGAFPPRSTHLKMIAVPLVVAVATFTAADFLVAGVNYHHYRIFETNEFRCKSFLRAYGATLRIKPDQWSPFITFPRDARERAYAVSPAARELESAYEGDIGRAWVRLSCTSKGKPEPCNEVEAGWAIWEFRDAVAHAGHYRSGAEAMHYYDTLADQINAACDRGTIQCLPPRATLLPPFRWEYLGESVQAGKAIARVIFSMTDSPIVPIPRPSADFANFTDTIDAVPSVMRENTTVKGWVAATEMPKLRLVGDGMRSFESSIKITPAPNILTSHPTLQGEHFELTTNCPVDVCALLLQVDGKDEARIPLTKLLASVNHAPANYSPTLMLNVESVLGLEDHRFTDSRRIAQMKIANLIASIYANVFPTLAALAGLGLMLTTLFRRQCPVPAGLLALGMGSAVAVGTLLALMSYLAASSDFTVANVLYTSPSSPFVITFTFAGVYALFIACRSAISAVIASPALRFRFVNAKEK